MLRQWPGPINPTLIQAAISFAHFNWNMAILMNNLLFLACPEDLEGARPSREQPGWWPLDGREGSGQDNPFGDIHELVGAFAKPCDTNSHGFLKSIYCTSWKINVLCLCIALWSDFFLCRRAKLVGVPDLLCGITYGPIRLSGLYVFPVFLPSGLFRHGYNTVYQDSSKPLTVQSLQFPCECQTLALTGS
jgi:hypothetical protein